MDLQRKYHIGIILRWATRKERTTKTQNLVTDRVLGVAQPATLQISAREALFSRAAEAAMPLVE